MTKVRSSHEFQ